MQKEPI